MNAKNDKTLTCRIDAERRVGRGFATAAIALTLVGAGFLVLAPTVGAHDCRSDDNNPNGCDAECTEGEDHNHFVDNDLPAADYECHSAAPPPAPQCDDGEDNDGDGKIDGEDPGCTSTSDNWEADDNDDTSECKLLTVTVPDSMCDVSKDVCDIVEEYVSKCSFATTVDVR